MSTRFAVSDDIFSLLVAVLSCCSSTNCTALHTTALFFTALLSFTSLSRPYHSPSCPTQAPSSLSACRILCHCLELTRPPCLSIAPLTPQQLNLHQWMAGLRRRWRSACWRTSRGVSSACPASWAPSVVSPCVVLD